MWTLPSRSRRVVDHIAVVKNTLCNVLYSGWVATRLMLLPERDQQCIGCAIIFSQIKLDHAFQGAYNKGPPITAHVARPMRRHSRHVCVRFGTLRRLPSQSTWRTYLLVRRSLPTSSFIWAARAYIKPFLRLLKPPPPGIFTLRKSLPSISFRTPFEASHFISSTAACHHFHNVQI